MLDSMFSSVSRGSACGTVAAAELFHRGPELHPSASPGPLNMPQSMEENEKEN